MQLTDSLELWSFYSSLKPASTPEEVGRFELSETIEDQPILSGLKRINFFIGPNNSGKSQLMRSFTKEFGEYVLQVDYSPLVKCLWDFDEAVSQHFQKPIEEIPIRRGQNVSNGLKPSQFIWWERFGSAIGTLGRNTGHINHFNDLIAKESSLSTRCTVDFLSMNE